MQRRSLLLKHRLKDQKTQALPTQRRRVPTGFRSKRSPPPPLRTDKLTAYNSSAPVKPKKKKDETLADLTSWPTPQQSQTSPSEPRRHDPAEENAKAITSPQTPTEGSEDSSASNSKKKGTNWVPFKEIAPAPASYRQTNGIAMNGGVRGGRGGRGRREFEPRRDSTTRETRSERDRSDSASSSTNPAAAAPSASSSNSAGSNSAYNSRTGEKNERTDREPRADRGDSSSSRGSPYRENRSSTFNSRGPSSRRGGRGGFSRGGSQFVVPPMGGYPNFVPVMYMEEDQMREALLKQIEYYFSVDNLCKDLFLRQQMNEEGWVPLTLVMNFNRVRTLGADYETTLDVLATSKIIELKNDYVRKAGDWNTWLFPKKEEATGALAQETKSEITTENKPKAEETPKAAPPTTTPATSAPVATTSATTKAEEPKKVEEKKVEEKAATTENKQQTAESAKPAQPERRGFSDIVKKNSAPQPQAKPIPGKATTTAPKAATTATPVQTPQQPTTQPPTKAAAATPETNKPKSEEDEWQSVGPRKKRTGPKPAEKKFHGAARERHPPKREDAREAPPQRPANGAANGVPNGTARVPSILEEDDFDDETLNKLFVVFRSPENASTAPITPSSSQEATGPSGKAEGGSKTVTELGIIINEGLYSLEQTLNSSSPVKTSSSQRFYVPKDKSGTNAKPEERMQRCIGWFIGSSSLPVSGSESPKPFPEFKHVSFDVLKENGFTMVKYQQFRAKCLGERKRLGPGKAPEMDALYRFWSHFLRSSFNRQVYAEFKNLALEDAKYGARYGIKCLFRLYSYGLERKYRVTLYEDFQDLTLQEYNQRNLYGLEKYWALHKYRPDKNKLEKRPELAKLLEKFKTIQDFRAANRAAAEAATSAANNSPTTESGGANPWFQKRTFK
eukprot:TRINITY_DN5353_c0_g1_i2.p1 TRINITY_DN5353_c0_g1~~TRINITY_DN5353_c0_g1_i2.p1  ORF type:complete len:904 (-),score=234.82 TRINITY_DN5353_c0_g1_i2:344-3055(-)